MKIYVVRHGQTDWNVAGKCQGRTDIELNNTGIEQAKNTKGQIKKYNIDLIICSPLKRAIKTAEIINEETKCNIIIDERLIERGCGEVEGTTEDEWPSIVDNEDIDIINNYNLNWNKLKVEPIQNVCNRVWNLLDEIEEKYKDKNILLVTHGGTCRAINAYFNGIGKDGHVQSAKIKNCEIREYQYKNGKIGENK